MNSVTFREWLAERGCRFDSFEHDERGHGPVRVTIHREGRKSELAAPGPHQALDHDTVRRICDELDLDWTQLPGPTSRA